MWNEIKKIKSKVKKKLEFLDYVTNTGARWLTDWTRMNEWMTTCCTRTHTHTHFMMMMIIIMTGILPIIFFLLYLFKNWKDDLIWWWWWWKWNENQIAISFSFFFTSLTLKLKNFFPKLLQRSHGGNGMKYNLALFFFKFQNTCCCGPFFLVLSSSAEE